MLVLRVRFRLVRSVCLNSSGMDCMAGWWCWVELGVEGRWIDWLVAVDVPRFWPLFGNCTELGRSTIRW